MSKSNNNSRPKREKDFELTAKIVLALTVIGIIVSTILIFTPPISGEEYAELGLLTFNQSTEQFEADNYPTNTIYNQTSGISEDITLYFLLSNHYNKAKYYEVRLKIGPQDLVITSDLYATNTSAYFYKNHWKQRILGVDEGWGPSNNTKLEFTFNSEIINKLGILANGYKIILELWEWNNQLETFVYNGVHVYLTSFQLVVVS